MDGIKPERELPVLMQYDAANRKLAFDEAAQLRGEGRSVVMRHVEGPENVLSDTIAREVRTGPLGPAYGEIRTYTSF
ncbi:hypothetical protein D3C76_1677190 [compost metagenome]